MPQEPAVPPTVDDRRAHGRLWSALLVPWDRAEDLAKLLGLHRTTLVKYSADVPANLSAWSTLRAACRVTARRFPDAIPMLMQQLGEELFDVRGTWIPDGAGDPAALGQEVDEVIVAAARLTVARANHEPPEVLGQYARSVMREAGDVAESADAASGSTR